MKVIYFSPNAEYHNIEQMTVDDFYEVADNINIMLYEHVEDFESDFNYGFISDEGIIHFFKD